jgi:hypothetical protein
VSELKSELEQRPNEPPAAVIRHNILGIQEVEVPEGNTMLRAVN